MKAKGLVLEGQRFRSPDEVAPPLYLPDVSRFGNDGVFGAGAAAPTWTRLPSGLWVLTFDGANTYIDATGANTPSLDIISSDYTILGWINWLSSGVSQHILGRYVLDNNGWEIYLTEWGGDFSLTNRHHHSGTIVDTHPRTAYNSTEWTQGIWHFMAITRSGNLANHYRNGVDLATTFSTGGLVDPEACTQDLTIGIRYTKNAEWYFGMQGLLRVCKYAMSQDQINQHFEAERRFFGV